MSYVAICHCGVGVSKIVNSSGQTISKMDAMSEGLMLIAHTNNPNVRIEGNAWGLKVRPNRPVSY